MANQMTELLKGSLEGIVLGLLAQRPAYGYEITAQLRDAGFTDSTPIVPQLANANTASENRKISV